MRKEYRAALADAGGEGGDAEFWSAIWKSESIETCRRNLARFVEASDEFRAVRSHLEALPPARRRALDGGCGLGQWVAYLADRGFEATGVDFSRPTIRRLREAFPELRWMDGDITALDVPEHAYDLYLSWGTFEHFESGLGGPLTEARRILAPGGLLMFSVPHESLRVQLQRAGPVRGNAATALTFYQWRFRPEELLLECERHGFDVLSLRPIHSREGARRLVRSIGGGALGARVAEGMARGLELLLPSSWLGHMVVAVARNRE